MEWFVELWQRRARKGEGRSESVSRSYPPETIVTQDNSSLTRRSARPRATLAQLDIDLNGTPAPGEWVAPASGVASAPAADGPSLFTALQEQLGLKLNPVRAP